MRQPRRILAVVMSSAFLFGAAACGGDDDDSAATDTDAADAVDGGGDTDGGVNGDGGVGGPAVATVTVDGTTYTASDEVVCVTFAAGLSAQFVDRETGIDIDIDIDLPPEDWETDTGEDWDPPSVRVDVGDESQFESGRSDVLVGMPETAVTSYSIDGNHASGDGDFVDMFSLPAEAVAVSGSFDVTCAEK